MKKTFVAAGFFLFSFMSPLKANAASFSKVFFFGDSLTDPGNVFNTTKLLGDPNQVFPPSPPYFQGRFSNGPVWAETFGKQLGLSPTLVTELGTKAPTDGINFAFGGSSSGLKNSIARNSTIPGVLAQVNLFSEPLKASNQKADPNALYVVQGGANDYLFDNLTDPTIPIRNFTSAVQSLIDAGAKNIMVFNLPDLGQLPITRINPQVSAGLTTLTEIYNSGFNATVANLKQQPGVNIIPIDVNSLFNQVLADPGKFGFKNVANSCLVGDFNAIQAGNFSLCSNPEDFFFFDGVHPTTRGHNLVAQAALTAVQNNSKSIPEPSTALGLLAFGALGAAGVVNRQQKKPTLMVN
jgi:phospholipase/lecithinase/hemolysin